MRFGNCAFFGHAPSVARLRAIEKLVDQNLLDRIALDDDSRRVRGTAVRKLENQALLLVE